MTIILIKFLQST